MASIATGKAAAALFLVFVLTLFAATPAKRRPANLEGYVYEECVDSKLVGPVRGAVVSTSVDATTASTDAAGHFHLLTNRPVFSDESHDVTVRAGAVVVDDHLTLPPDSRVQLVFVLSPPEPVLFWRQRSGRTFCRSFPFRRAVAKQGK